MNSGWERISSQKGLTYVSVVARLEGDTVVPYPVADDIEIFMIEDDLFPAELMLSRAQQMATEQKWIYRVVGFLLLFFGLLFFWEWIKSIAGFSRESW